MKVRFYKSLRSMRADVYVDVETQQQWLRVYITPVSVMWTSRGRDGRAGTTPTPADTNIAVLNQLDDGVSFQEHTTTPAGRARKRHPFSWEEEPTCE